MQKKSSLSGFTSGLFNSARFVCDYLDKKKFVESSVALVDNENQIDYEIVKFKADVVIIEAIWVTPKKLNELTELKRHSKRKFIIRIHSKIPFLSNEGQAFTFITQYLSLKRENILISPNTIDLYKSLKVCFKSDSFLFLPNLYQVSNPFKKIHLHKRHIDICCFGAIRPMKNTLQQAIAAIDFADTFNLKLYFHINSTRIEQDPHNCVLKNIIAIFNQSKRHKLVQHAWYSHSEFLSVCKEMDLGLQVSYSETFNIVAADLINSGVPVIGSKEIEYLPCISQANPNSISSIKNKLAIAYALPKLISSAQARKFKNQILENQVFWDLLINNNRPIQ